MLRLVGRRLLFVALILVVSSLLVFTATQILPGDVAQMILGRFATSQALENLREELGLNRPAAIQYLSWLGRFLRGDWGVSLAVDSPVFPLVMRRLRNSGMLALTAFLLYVPLGILLGLAAALRRNRLTDQIISVTSLAFVGLPEFVIGVVLFALFSLRW